MIFVFGSNLAGRHGKGAALYARQHHGAQYGVGVGRTGNTYAIPTKDAHLRTLSLSVIDLYVRDFLAYAEAYPELEFEVTKIGCGLAGYKESDIAPMFAYAPSNCHLPEGWRPTTIKAREGFDEPVTPEVLARAKALGANRRQGEDGPASDDQQEALRAIRRLRFALRAARDVFAHYAAIHAEKTPPDTEKAARNLELTRMCDEALGSDVSRVDPPMDKSQIKRLSIQTGGVPTGRGVYFDYDDLLKLVAVVAAQARTACATTCEDKHANGNWKYDTRHECADAIRRGL